MLINGACGFCDASESAMAAVVHGRAVINEEVFINLFAGKTKVGATNYSKICQFRNWN